MRVSDGVGSFAMRSLWLEQALAGETEAPALAGEERADVCVVGGGYTGLWTALRLKGHDASLDVVLLEADVCGGGASGRNGGLVLSWWTKFLTLERRCGLDEALRLARASAEAVAAVGSFCEAHAIDAHYRPSPWLWAATSPRWLGAWSPTVRRLEELGERPFREVEAEEARALTGSPRILGGALEATAAVVQPALLARGLRRLAAEHGVRIFERSPVTALVRDGVRTPRGRVRAGRVVLALGPWTIQVRSLRRALVVVSSDMVATAPLADDVADLPVCVSDARARIEYYRATSDGRIAFGKGGGTLAYGSRVGRAFHGPAARAPEVESALHRFYPDLADVPIAASWTGPVDRSSSGLPFFGRLEEGAVYGAGYSGRGVAQSYLGGRILASLALDLEDEWSACGLVGAADRGFPPEPGRYLGGLTLRSAITASERAEDEGRRPPALAWALTRLAPRDLLPRPAQADRGSVARDP